jgi:hypothetical protein
MSIVKQETPTALAQSSVPQGLAITHDVRLRTAQAQTMAQYQMAFMLPRDWSAVQAKLLLACQDPDFAKEAVYSKPAGRDKIQGLTIRFAELALRLMRNINVETSPEMEDDFSVHYRTTATDLESNTTSSETFKVEKTVERKFIKEDDTVISKRTNSANETTYLIPATEDQLNTKLRAQMSKVKRSLILALVPAEVKEQCLQLCLRISTDADAVDPGAAMKSLVSAFISIGIDVPDLKEYLGKSPASATAPQVQELRGIYALIRDGEMTWSDVMLAKKEREAAQGSKAAFVEQKQKERAAKKNKPPASAAAATPKPRGRPPGSGATAAGGVMTPAADKTTPAATPETKPDPPKARASRRGDDDDDDQGDDAGQDSGKAASNSHPA